MIGNYMCIQRDKCFLDTYVFAIIVMGLHIQFFVVTHRGSSDAEIDHYISTLLAPAVVIYVFSRWGADPLHKVSGSVCFYEASIGINQE